MIGCFIEKGPARKPNRTGRLERTTLQTIEINQNGTSGLSGSGRESRSSIHSRDSLGKRFKPSENDQEFLREVQVVKNKKKTLSEKNIHYLAHIRTKEDKEPLTLPEIRWNTEARIGTDRMIEIILHSLPEQPEPSLEGFSYRLPDEIETAKGWYVAHLSNVKKILKQPWSTADFTLVFPYIRRVPPEIPQANVKEGKKDPVAFINSFFQRCIIDEMFRQKCLEIYHKNEEQGGRLETSS